MQFTDEDIRKYQELCRKYFDEEVDEKAAIEELNSLIFMVSLIYHPLSEEHLQHMKEAGPVTASDKLPKATRN